MSRASRGKGSSQRRVRPGSAGESRPDPTLCPPCAICGHCGRGERALHHLTHGLSVWLCHGHRSDVFMRRRSGREFVERLAAVWLASGMLTVRKREALAAHLRRVEAATDTRDRPGSYSWPALRREAERRFAAGEAPADVIAELRRTYRDGPAMVPSLRTMRRWFTQARWLATTPDNRRHEARAAARRPGAKSRWQPLIELILTGVAYPTTPVPRSLPRGP